MYSLMRVVVYGKRFGLLISFRLYLFQGPEPTIAMQQQLRDKQRELLELQARKLELELLTTKKRIMEQEKQLSIQTESVAKEVRSLCISCI